MKPWAKSTGPKSLKGKAAVSRNTFNGGHLVKLRELIKEVDRALRQQRQRLG